MKKVRILKILEIEKKLSPEMIEFYGECDCRLGALKSFDGVFDFIFVEEVTDYRILNSFAKKHKEAFYNIYLEENRGLKKPYNHYIPKEYVADLTQQIEIDFGE